ncbi:hypothetical protein AMTRI_Chr02g223720 [Amborella trichopoda]|uniref:Uncharacterized protein n=1 Tax=Amborella trichopoda TaxID=13333 RepID=W1P355_AMBTC|nr:uncharacterized protein LOC18430181 [Amborella trichopoda]ERN02079.1 hypothetical protein AMTR_s00045p00147920 [Amborella trichopoda]|eukprot:XP_006840404.1 uncharacterized protein LOC18430181 [Amborella trichopoda]
MGSPETGHRSQSHDDLEHHFFQLSLSDKGSKISFDSSDGDADAELSDDKEETAEERENSSDQELSPYGSKPRKDMRQNSELSGVGSPLNRLRLEPLSQPIDIKHYASENEVRERGRKKKFRRGGLRRARESRIEKTWEIRKSRAQMEDGLDETDNHSVASEFHEQNPTTPRERNSMCMDLDEVKACWDLGFGLHQLSFSTIETSSSGLESIGNSPIAHWRISSPGDHPRDVKARLKVWAQAVASTARLYS